MNQHDDEFLTRFRRPPRPEFANELTARLAQIEPDPPARTTHLRLWPTPISLTRRRILLGGAAALVAAVTLGITLLVTGDSGTVGAEAILEQAQVAATDASGATGTIHLRATLQKSDGTSQEIETWQRAGGYVRSEIVQRNATGAVDYTFGRVTNPTRRWGFYTQNSQTYYGTTAIDPADPAPRFEHKEEAPQNAPPGTTLDGFLDKSRQCGDARRQPDDIVANRPAYVVVLGYGGCQGESAKPDALAIQPGQMTLWLDKESFVLLKSESRDASRQVTDRYEVTSIEFHMTIPDSVFTYTPPPGAIEGETGPPKPVPDGSP